MNNLRELRERVGRCHGESEARPRPIRVGLWQSLEYGGLERWAVSLAETLDRRHVETVGLVPADPKAWNDPMIRAALERQLPILPDLEALLALEPDVIVASCIRDLGQRLPVGWSKPVVLVGHGVCNYTKAWVQSSAARATHLVGVAEVVCQRLREWTGREAACVPNGVDLQRAAPHRPRAELRSGYGIPDDAFVVAYAGRLVKDKGIAKTMAAACLIPRGIGLFAGWGPGAKLIHDAASAYGAADRVRIVPATPLVGDVFGAADVFCSPSEAEGFGLSVVEALAARVPTVCTSTGVVAEAERRFGKLCETVAADATDDEVAAACLRATAPVGRETVERGFRIARDHYSAARMAAAWTSYLKMVVGRLSP